MTNPPDTPLRPPCVAGSVNGHGHPHPLEMVGRALEQWAAYLDQHADLLDPLGDDSDGIPWHLMHVARQLRDTRAQIIHHSPARGDDLTTREA